MKRKHEKLIRVPDIFRKALYNEKAKNPDAKFSDILTCWGNEKLNKNEKKKPIFPKW